MMPKLKQALFKPLKRPLASDVVNRDSPGDYTQSSSAPNRSFYVTLLFMRFGTTDKFQGAAFFLTLVLLLLLVGAWVVGIWYPTHWEKAWDLLTTPFTLALGVAIGSSSKTKDDNGNGK